jgi:hypothetical protein
LSFSFPNFISKGVSKMMSPACFFIPNIHMLGGPVTF